MDTQMDVFFKIDGTVDRKIPIESSFFQIKTKLLDNIKTNGIYKLTFIITKLEEMKE